MIISQTDYPLFGIGVLKEQKIDAVKALGQYSAALHSVASYYAVHFRRLVIQMAIVDL